MEELDNFRTGEDLLPSNIKESVLKNLRDAIQKMHDSGYVHGDLRPTNIMWNSDGEVRIIDFDWAGNIGEATYPSTINLALTWHPGVKECAKIEPEHDLFQFNRIKEIWKTNIPGKQSKRGSRKAN
eukprot:TRINITY_DN12607_c0_g1_i1.p1 TRINITY_DN12607_c0_g1~~TRINITY_DN12607_c0_g1_i1.p1  ORF type:complete len:126 (-),score=31.39 TRINITY_DN12607_c0_g1_i1:68-445(-)